MRSTSALLSLSVFLVLGCVSAIDFSQWKTCSDCVAAGYGWCPNVRKCGGFANKSCGEGPRYHVKELDEASPGPLDEPAPAKTDKPMELTAGNFQKVAMDDKSHSFVMFYAPWCGHCKRMHPEMDRAAAAFADEDLVYIAQVDADKHTDLASAFGVQGYPTIKYFPAGTGMLSPEAYQGERTAEAIVDYMNLKAGTQRKMDGSIDIEAGLNHSFDEYVAAFFAAGGAGGTEDEIIASALAAAESLDASARYIAKTYAIALKKLKAEGAGYFERETLRLTRLRTDDKTSKDKKTEFAGRINVLKYVQDQYEKAMSQTKSDQSEL